MASISSKYKCSSPPNANILPSSNTSKRSPCIPEGIQSILNTCQSIYPDQSNPRQVTTQLKFWLGGPDPLDYITIYYHAGEEGVCVPHWHYVSMGLSDLHGDERVHDRNLYSSAREKMSGFGFELTFRVKVMKDSDGVAPMWPVELMQSLASYIFTSQTDFKPGDYITWNSPIDNSPNSLLTQLFVIEDAQLLPLQTKLGWVSFLQVVGASQEELSAAQSWKVVGLVDLMKEHMATGGPYQVCDQHRDVTLFQLSERAKLRVREAIKLEGSNLSGFSTECMWCETNGRDTEMLSPVTSLQNVDPTFAASWTNISESSFETQDLKHVREVTITLCTEAFLLLPKVLRGRLKHGKPFTFRSPSTDIAITLVPHGISGTFVSSSAPYVAKSSWLQVFTPISLVDELLAIADTYSSQYRDKKKADFDIPSYSLHLCIYSYKHA